MKTSAKIIADSTFEGNTQQRITTFEIVYPRFILAEVNTHRLLSKSSQSSRAVPVTKHIAMIEEQPFVPQEFGRNKPGMEAGSEIEEATQAKMIWLNAKDDAVSHAKQLVELGVHKQFANRLLEPFSWARTVITGTEWDNFFALRTHKAAQPQFQKLARMMKTAMQESESTAKSLRYGEMHLPYVSEEEIAELIHFKKLIRISAARCARVSYRLHDGSPANLTKDFKLAEDLLSMEHMCYSSDTEVLCENGSWKFINEVNDDEKIAVVDIDNNIIKFEIPSKWYRATHSGTMLHFTSQHIDALVTENHRMVCKRRKYAGFSSAYQFTEANTMKNGAFKLRRCAQIKTEGVNWPIDLTLLGMYIGDGGVHGNRIQFHVLKQRKIDMLKNLGCLNNRKDHYYKQCNKTQIEWIKNNCGYSAFTKKLPDDFINLNKHQVLQLLKGLQNSDGSIRPNSWTYCSTSKQLILQLQTLCAVNDIGTYLDTANKTYFSLSICQKKDLPFCNSSKSTKQNLRSIEYEGYVHCPTVSTGALLVKRNDKILVSGNSPFDHAAYPVEEDYRECRQYYKWIPARVDIELSLKAEASRKTRNEWTKK